ncbi:MAG: BamA/TamA family outer membrane protein [Kofleriaceae bacterium]
MALVRLALVLGSLIAITSVASAQPSPPPPPAATAPDGLARTFERAPRSSHIRGEFIVRAFGRGVGWLIRTIEGPIRSLVYLEARWRVFSRVREVFVNDAHTLGIYPTVTFQSAFGVTLGAKAFLEHVLGDDKMVLSAERGGSVREAFQYKYELSTPSLYLRARARYEDNTNQLFAGIGNKQPAVNTRFSQTRFLGLLATGAQLGKHLQLGGSAIFNDRDFGPAGDTSTDPSIETAYDTATVNGFDDGIRTAEVTGNVELDTRDKPGLTNRGVVVRGFAGTVRQRDRDRNGHYGAEVISYFTAFWPTRVFVTRVALEGVIDRNDDIPFTELPRLGGTGMLRGYSSGQFRDKLATSVTLEYRYPIHANLAGSLFVEGGKVARTYEALAGFDAWHLGYGGGWILNTSRAIKFRLDLAYGDGLNVYFSTDVIDAFRNREGEL